MLSSPYQGIVRVQLRRNLQRSIIVNRKCRISLYLSSEFHEAVEIDNPIIYRLSLVYPDSTIKTIDSYKVISVTGPETLIDFVLRSFEEGEVRLLIEGVDTTARFLLIPFVSDYFSIVKENVQTKQLQVPSLCNYRIVNSSQTSDHVSLWVKEEYGLTIGSHIYDSAIVLITYLQHLGKPEGSSRCVVELGSGCGLVSIFCMVVMGYDPISTDRREQLALLQENFKINKSKGKEIIIEFDWNSPTQLDHLKSCLLVNNHESANRVVDYILAADVLYDASVIHQFLRVLSKLFRATMVMNLASPIILIAQKNRNRLSSDQIKAELLQYYADIKQEDDQGNCVLEIHSVYEMAEVIVWEFQFQVV